MIGPVLLILAPILIAILIVHLVAEGKRKKRELDLRERELRLREEKSREEKK